MEISEQQYNELLKRITDLESIIGKPNWNTSMIRFVKQIIFGNAVDLSNGITGSLKHTGDKVGFYGTTPITQQTEVSAPTSAGATYDQTVAQSAVNAINQIRTRLQNLGITQ